MPESRDPQRHEPDHAPSHTDGPPDDDALAVFGEDSAADFEIVISSLDDAPGASRPAPIAGWADSDSGASPLPFAMRVTPRRRLVAALTAGGAVLLALIVVLGTFPGAGTMLGAALGFTPPAPTQTLVPGASTVFFMHSVPWGTLTLDAHTASLAPVTASGAFPQLTLARGTHTLAYTAAPFPTVRCRISVPLAPSDNCPLASPNTIFTASGIPGVLRTLDLQATPDHLPPAQYAALQHAVQAALVFPDGQVQPGDHYRSQTTKTITAASPLTAHLLVTLPPWRTQGANFNGETCDPLCPDTIGVHGGGGAWDLDAIIDSAWQFVDGDGQVVDATPYSAPGVLPVSLEAEWTGAWHVTLGFPTDASEDICLTGADQYDQVQGGGEGFSLQTTSGENPADGCLLRVAPQTGGGPPPTPGPTPTPAPKGRNAALTILYRFGALVAADDATQQALPQLSAPSAHERAIIATFSTGP